MSGLKTIAGFLGRCIAIYLASVVVYEIGSHIAAQQREKKLKVQAQFFRREGSIVWASAPAMGRWTCRRTQNDFIIYFLGSPGLQVAALQEVNGGLPMNAESISWPRDTGETARASSDDVWASVGEHPELASVFSLVTGKPIDPPFIHLDICAPRTN